MLRAPRHDITADSMFILIDRYNITYLKADHLIITIATILPALLVIILIISTISIGEIKPNNKIAKGNKTIKIKESPRLTSMTLPLSLPLYNSDIIKNGQEMSQPNMRCRTQVSDTNVSDTIIDIMNDPQ
jgi:hypothetical protein